ncbi:MAG: undecaprenyl diphosphate synthase family protein [Acidilobaceae archaeon]|nr:undecaprenyl diphosphate synthase family protein [Acidilobaceae archaeon]MCX8165083.1 undecaprenyl diphosphate synthase family protein [Acidilobaceae archaeon]MDW7974400.1 undecaprenyl diphosphate synthase family protein [Sulfolobales archaeon]
MKSLLHVGIIPDGNRRWARRRGLALAEAYSRGYEVMRSTVERLADEGVRHITVFAMSRDNCARRESFEREILFKLVDKALSDLKSGRYLRGYTFSVRVVGDLQMSTPRVREAVESVKGLEGELSLNVGLCYGKEWEEEVMRKGIRPLEGIPQIDLVIRTGGMQRLSDFFPSLVRYAEFYFTQSLWPDFTQRELEEALAWFYSRKRNFGK